MFVYNRFITLLFISLKCGVSHPQMSVVGYSLIKSKKGQKMNEYQKAMAIVKRYAKANIPLTKAEQNLLKHLKAKYNK
jgi:hypothetical protein